MKTKLIYLLCVIISAIPNVLAIILHFLYLLFMILYDLNSNLLTLIANTFDDWQVKSEVTEVEYEESKEEQKV